MPNLRCCVNLQRQNIFYLIITLVLLLEGCGTITEQYPKHETRYWEKVPYKEKVIIRSEPSGAKIYFEDQYIGVSPVQTTFDTGNVIIEQGGIYLKDFEHGPIWGNIWYAQEHDLGKRATETKWGELTPELRTISFKVSAFKEGYDPNSQTITISSNDKVFLEAIHKLEPDAEGRLQHPVGFRSILIPLRSIPTPHSPLSQQQQQQQQQQQTVVIPDSRGSDAPEKGKVMVTSVPESADVSVDGVFVGNSPCTLPLSDGIHIIQVEAVGYAPFKREIRVMSGGGVTIRANLEKK